jgi:hypothetical protein
MFEEEELAKLFSGVDWATARAVGFHQRVLIFGYKERRIFEEEGLAKLLFSRVDCSTARAVSYRQRVIIFGWKEWRMSEE